MSFFDLHVEGQNSVEQVLTETLNPHYVSIFQVCLLIRLGGRAQHHECLIGFVEIFLGLDLR